MPERDECVAVNGEMPRRKKHKPLFIKVMVFECDTEKQIRNLRVDLSNGEKKDWLFDLVLWATLNGKAVEIVNCKDDG